MTAMVAFGHHDKLFLPKLTVSINPLMDMDNWYTNPSYDRFYSKHGFAYPMTGINPLDLVLGDNFITSEHVKNSETIYSYLLIDHKARLWHVVVKHLNDYKKEISQRFIDPEHNGWWILNVPYDQIRQNMLLGYLSTNPSDKAIHDHMFKHWGTIAPEVLSISEIAIRLKERYPLKKKYTTEELDTLIEKIEKTKV